VRFFSTYASHTIFISSWQADCARISQLRLLVTDVRITRLHGLLRTAALSPAERRAYKRALAGRRCDCTCRDLSLVTRSLAVRYNLLTARVDFSRASQRSLVRSPPPPLLRARIGSFCRRSLLSCPRLFLGFAPVLFRVHYAPTLR
jgi:hypothetical protein